MHSRYWTSDSLLHHDLWLEMGTRTSNCSSKPRVYCAARCCPPTRTTCKHVKPRPFRHTHIPQSSPFHSTPLRINQIRNLRQHVKVTALGLKSAERGWTILDAVRTKYQDHLKTRVVLPFNFLPYEGYSCIEAHARYFTDRHLVPYDKNIPFFDGVDPQGTLQQLQPPELVHAPDNYVEYLSKHRESDGKYRYVRAAKRYDSECCVTSQC